MRLLLCSEADNASVNIRDRLIEIVDWTESGEFDNRPVFVRDDMVMATIQQFHIHAEEIDIPIKEALDIDPEAIIFLSRHRSASGIPTLTVHPIGNHREARFGGREATLVPTSPHLMTSMLRQLRMEAKDLDVKVSFEVTHHGPYLSTPSVFIEIGSDESMWANQEAGEAIARTILNVKGERYPTVIGLGGGHYAPRFTDLVLKRKVSMGHMIPNYAMKDADEIELRSMVERATEASQASLVYVHRKSMKRSELTSMRGILGKNGLEIVDSKDLRPLQ